MSKPVLMKGNEALAEAALRAGMKAYFGYPITPQSEILEYLTAHGPEKGAVVLQAESELASINMVAGASGAGARVMTTSSSPGISLMQEGLSYIAASELPCVVANIVRGGPGLGTIQPSQSDYFQATRSGGHGDYHSIVLAPASVQEMADHTALGFELADLYRNPVIILTDGALGQMMEKVVMPDKYNTKEYDKPWATTGKAATRPRNIVYSLHLQPEELESFNKQLQAKYKTICEKEQRYELFQTDDAEYLIVAFGISARIAQKAVELGRQAGLKLGLVRPITVWPFPKDILDELSGRVDGILVFELNAGQMVDDVRLTVRGRTPIKHYGRMGGMMALPEEVLEQVKLFIEEVGAGVAQAR